MLNSDVIVQFILSVERLKISFTIRILTRKFFLFVNASNVTSFVGVSRENFAAI